MLDLYIIEVLIIGGRRGKEVTAVWYNSTPFLFIKFLPISVNSHGFKHWSSIYSGHSQPGKSLIFRLGFYAEARQIYKFLCVPIDKIVNWKHTCTILAYDAKNMESTQYWKLC